MRERERERERETDRQRETKRHNTSYFSTFQSFKR